MKCTIDGQLREPALICCQEKQFGQLRPSEKIVYVDYEIQLEPAEFIDRAQSIYQALVQDFKEDEKFPESVNTNPLMKHWRTLRYPDLSKLVESEPKIAVHLLQWYFGYRLLRSIFPFTSGQFSKPRPVLILRDLGNDCLINKSTFIEPQQVQRAIC